MSGAASSGSKRASALLAQPGDGESVVLCSPNVGNVSLALQSGDWLSAGQHVGVLEQLGRRTTLVMPPEVAGGRVRALHLRERPQAAAYGEPLFEIETISSESSAAQASAAIAEEPGDALVVHAPQSGRFYRRPNPSEPEFLAPGAEMHGGLTVGLLEVMKTFAPVRYVGERQDLRFDRYLVEDGAEVTKDTPVAALREADAEP